MKQKRSRSFTFVLVRALMCAIFGAFSIVLGQLVLSTQYVHIMYMHIFNKVRPMAKFCCAVFLIMPCHRVLDIVEISPGTKFRVITMILFSRTLAINTHPILYLGFLARLIFFG